MDSTPPTFQPHISFFVHFEWSKEVWECRLELCNPSLNSKGNQAMSKNFNLKTLTMWNWTLIALNQTLLWNPIYFPQFLCILNDLHGDGCIKCRTIYLFELQCTKQRSKLSSFLWTPKTTELCSRMLSSLKTSVWTLVCILDVIEFKLGNCSMFKDVYLFANYLFGHLTCLLNVVQQSGYFREFFNYPTHVCIILDSNFYD
jgi:hypothetical protein